MRTDYAENTGFQSWSNEAKQKSDFCKGRQLHIFSSKRNTDEQFFIEKFSLITYKVAHLQRLCDIRLF